MNISSGVYTGHMSNPRKKYEDGYDRLSIGIKPHLTDRWDDICKMFPDTSRAFWVEALCSVVSFKELQDLHDRVVAARQLEEVLQRKLTVEMLSMVRGKSSDTIRQITKAAENAVGSGPIPD